MAKKAVSSWKSKKRYTLVAPEYFEGRQLGSTIADDPGKLAGRTVKVNMKMLIDDRSKQYMNIIFEVDGGQAEMNIFRTALLLTRLFYFKMHEPASRPITHVIVLEEARRLIAPRRHDFGEPVLETMAALSREMGIGLVIISQEPTSVADVFKANICTNIAFGLSEGSQEKAIAHSLNLSKTQYEYYRSLVAHGPGNAIVR